MMLILITVLLIIIIFSRIIEESFKIPSTLSIIVLAFLVSYLFPNLFIINHEEFDEILYLMLPIILLPDILNLSIPELKKHAKEIFYLAFIAVIISILIASIITPYLLPQYQWNIGILIALFSMLMATDAITVASIMNKFKLPEQLKVYAESESLFNDVTALIIFYFIAIPLLNGGDVTFLSINITLVRVLILSIVIGVVIASIGYFSIKILKNTFDQFLIIYLVVIVSFLLAEHFHIAGILSIVSSVLTFKILLQKELSNENINRNIDNQINIQRNILELIKKVPAITKKEFREYKKEAMFIGIFANAIVFVIIANIINIDDMILHYKEIIMIFIITTIIRYGSIFTMIKAFNLPSRWIESLSLAGSKGALAIIMSHSLPNTFIYKEMFISIVIGNVILSTFIYTILLMFHIAKHKQEYKQDIITFNEKHITQDDYNRCLIDIIEKDTVTDAYNKSFIEDILLHEMARTQRYKINLALLCIEIPSNTKDDILEIIGTTVLDRIRVNDYFGKISEVRYIIITSNTSLSGAIVLAEKLIFDIEEKNPIKLFCGVTEISDKDTLDSVFDKIDDALSRAILKDGQQIEVEV